MKTTSQKLIEYIEKHGNVTAKELVDYLSITKQALYRYLNNFIEDRKIIKIGRTPKVFYLINKEKKQDIVKFDSSVEKKIKDNYFIIIRHIFSSQYDKVHNSPHHYLIHHPDYYFLLHLNIS